MKKILKEWKRFVNESKDTSLQIEIDLEKDEIVLYHVGWLSPDQPFEINSEYMFTGEPKSYSNMKRPLGNESIYFSSSKSGAERYKNYTSFPYLHKVKIPISKLAGSFHEDNIQKTLKYGVTASEEDFRAFAKQTMQNYKTDYKAEYQNLFTSLEVGIFDASIIEKIDAIPLFEAEDLRKFFDKISDHFNRTMSAPRNEEGLFQVKGAFGPKLINNTRMLRRINDVIKRYTHSLKLKNIIKTIQDYFPGEWEELMQRVEEFKRSLEDS